MVKLICNQVHTFMPTITQYDQADLEKLEKNPDLSSKEASK